MEMLAIPNTCACAQALSALLSSQCADTHHVNNNLHLQPARLFRPPSDPGTKAPRAVRQRVLSVFIGVNPSPGRKHSLELESGYNLVGWGGGGGGGNEPERVLARRGGRG